jgi:hypothetical protein
MAARIDDNDQQFMDDHWTYESGKPSQRVTYPLDADRFLKQPGALEEDASGRCVASGVRANIWARARRRADITHLLRGGGRFSMGWGALRWQATCNTDRVRFGRHGQIHYLAKKVANFLHEFHSDLFPSINLPRLPLDRSKVDVHAMLTPLEIALLLRRLQVTII